MKITRSWCSVTGQEKFRLEINTDGASLAEAMTRALRLVQTTANCDGGAAWEAYRSWISGEISGTERNADKLRADIARVTKDKEYWHQNWREADSERDELRAEAADLRSQLAEARAERDEAWSRAARDLYAALRERDAAREKLEARNRAVLAEVGEHARALDALERRARSAESGRDALRAAYRACQRFVALALKTAAAMEAEANKLAERRDRWRKRAETAGELAATMRDQRDEAIAQARAARDLAAVRNGIAEELVKTRAELAQARRKALTDAAEAVAADAYRWAPPLHRAVMLETAGKLRAWAESEAPTWRGPIEVPEPTPGAEPEPVESVFKACGYTKVEGDRDLLGAILAAVEAIRDDLALMGQTR